VRPDLPIIQMKGEIAVFLHMDGIAGKGRHLNGNGVVGQEAAGGVAVVLEDSERGPLVFVNRDMGAANQGLAATAVNVPGGAVADRDSKFPRIEENRGAFFLAVDDTLHLIVLGVRRRAPGNPHDDIFKPRIADGWTWTNGDAGCGHKIHAHLFGIGGLSARDRCGGDRRPIHLFAVAQGGYREIGGGS